MPPRFAFRLRHGSLADARSSELSVFWRVDVFIVREEIPENGAEDTQPERYEEDLTHTAPPIASSAPEITANRTRALVRDAGNVWTIRGCASS